MSAATSPESLAMVRPFAELSRADVSWAGGKGANLGELSAAGLPVPTGFVVGAPAYAATCEASGVRESLIRILDGLDPDDTTALDAAASEARAVVEAAAIPPAIEAQIRGAYAAMDPSCEVAIAVRSSATAEDTGSDSFAGMNETFLNVRGADALIDAVRRCWGSLFGARTIFYRAKRGLDQASMDIAVVVQEQVQALRAGVMFTLDPATGDRDLIVIEGSLGLGESVVSGSVSPDLYVVRKRPPTILSRELQRKELVIESARGGGTQRRRATEEEATGSTLSDAEVLQVARLGLQVEAHYGEPQDTEWAFDAAGKAWMLQARPVTLTAAPPKAPGPPAPPKGGGTTLVQGLGAAPGIASGPVRVIRDLASASRLRDGDVLVAPMTAPDWVPLLRRARALVTDAGGVTCHAAIVARELGIPCIVGTGDATRTLADGQHVTVDAARGVVLAGDARQVVEATATPPSSASPPEPTATQLLLNLSSAAQVEHAAQLPVDGVGLLRAELMLIDALDGTHPRLLLEEGHREQAVAKMAESIVRFASAFGPRPVTYRTTDFRTNEFRGLRGGERFEPLEANPMIGFRGALRYLREPEVFALELEAISRVFDAGHTNVHLMIPFVRSERELRRCRDLVAAAGLLGRPGFELWVMAEVPSVLFAIDGYAALGIAGISIGSNDLTQLLLGVDRDSALVAETFDALDPSVVAYIQQLIARAKRLGLKTSICGQAPSIHPEYTEMLVRAGIDAISVSLDAVDRTHRLIASAEHRLVLDAARERLGCGDSRDMAPTSSPAT